MDLKEKLKDGGYKSRKLWLVVWTQVLLVGAAGAACKCAAMVGLYPTLAGSLIAAAALFITGNVAAKHVLGKQGDATDEVTVTEKDEPADEKK
jgi:hypothetical protein